jgi:hypothetical protein
MLSRKSGLLPWWPLMNANERRRVTRPGTSFQFARLDSKSKAELSNR